LSLDVRIQAAGTPPLSICDNNALRRFPFNCHCGGFRAPVRGAKTTKETAAAQGFPRFCRVTGINCHYLSLVRIRYKHLSNSLYRRADTFVTQHPIRPRAPRARGIFMVPIYRRMHFQQEWNGLHLRQQEQAASRPAPLWTRREGEARRSRGSVGASLGPDQVEAVVAFACHPRVDGCQCAAIPDTETGSMLPRGRMARLRRARHDPLSCTVIRQVAPSSALIRGLRSAVPGP
jgi:hypothetical protein